MGRKSRTCEKFGEFRAGIGRGVFPHLKWRTLVGMLRRLGRLIYKGIFWDAERATWQYDVMVALILGFIFLSPRVWFNDRPAEADPGDLVRVSSSAGRAVYEMRADLMERERAGSVEQVARRVLAASTGRPVRVLEVVAQRDASGQVVSYAVSVKE